MSIALTPTSRRWLMRGRRPVLALLGIVLVLGGVLFGVLGWLQSDDGREELARRIEDVISDGIRGSVTIGGIDAIGERDLHAHDVVFEDESGRTVIEARDVWLELDFAELAAGRFVSERGRVHGGLVVLETIPSGELLLDRAFESPRPGPPGAPIGPDVVRLENLVADGVEVRIEVDGVPDATISNVSTICLVRAPEHGSVRFRADRIDGDAHFATPIPVDFSIDDGSLTLIGDARRRATLTLPTVVGGEPVTIDTTVRMNAREEAHVDVHLIPSSFGAVFTSSALVTQALIAETLTSALDVTVDLP
jgi:hypothetical protein